MTDDNLDRAARAFLDAHAAWSADRGNADLLEDARDAMADFAALCGAVDGSSWPGIDSGRAPS